MIFTNLTLMTFSVSYHNLALWKPIDNRSGGNESCRSPAAFPSLRDTQISCKTTVTRNHMFEHMEEKDNMKICMNQAIPLIPGICRKYIGVKCGCKILCSIRKVLNPSPRGAQ